MGQIGVAVEEEVNQAESLLLAHFMTVACVYGKEHSSLRNDSSLSTFRSPEQFSFSCCWPSNSAVF